MEKNKDFKIINGDSLKVLDTFEPNSIDAIITDPPYGLTSITKRFGKENSTPCKEGKDGSFARLTKGFMGKEWDGSGIEYNVDLWRKAYNVLKPGAYLLAFGGTRTYHRIACAIEDAGFEIRDTIMWLYGSGFPKSHNVGLDIDKLSGMPDRGHRVAVANRCHPDGTIEPNGDRLEKYEGKTEEGKKWQGYGTALKPAYEPIIVARKPIEDTVAKNILKYGVGAINIDECRVSFDGEIQLNIRDTSKSSEGWKRPWQQDKEKDRRRQEIATEKANNLGRFPANVILTYDDTDFDEVCGGMPTTKSMYNEFSKHEKQIHRENKDTLQYGYKERIDSSSYNDEGSAARYFYCAKASKKDRDGGLIDFGFLTVDDGRNKPIDNAFQRGETLRKNIHPTVKPVELMQYLVRLICPKGATILDIFNGSGSTGKAVAFENRERDAHYKYIGIELDKEYCRISESRIDYALHKYQYDVLEEIKENEEKGQLSLFDFGEEYGQ